MSWPTPGGTPAPSGADRGPPRPYDGRAVDRLVGAVTPTFSTATGAGQPFDRRLDPRPAGQLTPEESRRQLEILASYPAASGVPREQNGGGRRGSAGAHPPGAGREAAKRLAGGTPLMEDRDLPKFVRDRLRELERSAALARHDFEAARSELDAAQRQMFDARLKARGQSRGPEQAEALRRRADEQQARVSELDQRVRDLGQQPHRRRQRRHPVPRPPQ